MPAGALADPHFTCVQQQVLGCGRGGAGLVLWRSVPVHHCSDAFGLVLAHKDGWKIVYSGEHAMQYPTVNIGMCLAG